VVDTIPTQLIKIYLAVGRVVVLTNLTLAISRDASSVLKQATKLESVSQSSTAGHALAMGMIEHPDVSRLSTFKLSTFGFKQT